MKDISIRLASPPSAEVLADLHEESFGAEKWSLDQMLGNISLPTTKIWIAYEDETPVGFIWCQVVQDEIEILTFCVTTTRRRSGIGELLLRQLAIEAQGREIFLEVAADNIAARNLYEKLGFAATGTRTNYYKRGAVTVDAVMYMITTM